MALATAIHPSLRRADSTYPVPANPVDPKTGTMWHSVKLGPGCQLDSSLTTLSRRARSGWGCQLGEAWYGALASEDEAVIVLHLRHLAPDAFIGVVGHNFYPGEWDRPLNESM